MFDERFARCEAIVGIPVRDEQEHIGACLGALAAQTGSQRYGIVLLLNNCLDQTAEIVRQLSPRLGLPICTLIVDLGPGFANPGYARRLVMEKADELAAENAALMTTDADGRVARDWIATSLAILRSGADVVAGRAIIDPVDAALIPPRLHEDDARECRYGGLIDEIRALLDPDLFDPWPRHTEHSGASLAISKTAYRKAGGIPPIAVGEDRAFVEALKRIDARIRHAPEVQVIVSGRIIGRAVGGMADTIRRRMSQPDILLDETLEPAVDAARRAWLRKLLNIIWRESDCHIELINMLAECASLNKDITRRLTKANYFGEAWAELESRSPVLRRKRVPLEDLDNQTAWAEVIIRAVRNRESTQHVSAGRDGSALREVAEGA
jgi:GT2 family glycosyltransferase